MERNKVVKIVHDGKLVELRTGNYEKWWVTFDDSDVEWEFLTRDAGSELAFKEGETIDYEIKQSKAKNDKFNKARYIRPKTPGDRAYGAHSPSNGNYRPKPAGPNDERQKSIELQVAMKLAQEQCNRMDIDSSTKYLSTMETLTLDLYGVLQRCKSQV